jgi:hypothetical protein
MDREAARGTLIEQGEIEPWQGVIFAIIATMQWQRAGALR